MDLLLIFRHPYLGFLLKLPNHLLINHLKRCYSLGRVLKNLKNKIKNQNRNTNNNKRESQVKINNMNKVLHNRRDKKDILINNNFINKNLMSLDLLELREIVDHLNNTNNTKVLKNQGFYLGIKAEILNRQEQNIKVNEVSIKF